MGIKVRLTKREVDRKGEDRFIGPQEILLYSDLHNRCRVFSGTRAFCAWTSPPSRHFIHVLARFFATSLSQPTFISNKASQFFIPHSFFIILHLSFPLACYAVLSTAMGTVQEPNLKQASPTKLTFAELNGWDAGNLLKWIHQERPGLLEGDNLGKFESKFINKDVFVENAGEVEFFENTCGLPYRISHSLAKLATEATGGKISGIKSKFTIFIHTHYINCKLTTSQEADSRPKMRICPTSPLWRVSYYPSCHAHHIDCKPNNVTGIRELVKGADMSNPNAKIALRILEFVDREIAGTKSNVSCHAHHVDSKLTTSQETDSRPKVWTCPTLPR
jgi:hypothetical protein